MRKIDSGDVVIILLIVLMCAIFAFTSLQAYAKYKCGQYGYSESETFELDIYCIQMIETERILLKDIIGGE